MNKFVLLLFFCCLSVSGIYGQFRTKKVIGDHAVLQRDVSIPINGWGAPGEKVKVILDKKEYPGQADSDGRWSIVLPPRPAGGPFTIEIKSADNGLTYKDIYFGDVWLCSGQSNMEWSLKNTDNAEVEIAAAKDGMIRHFKVPKANEDKPVDELPDGKWEVLHPETAGDFTAVGYYFAKSIRETNDVPIGLLNSSWGGSRIEPWISKETLDKQNPSYSQSASNARNQTNIGDLKAKLKVMFPDLSDEDQGMDDGQIKWADNKEDDRWFKIDPLQLWERQGYESVDGIAYYRTQFTADDGFTLKLGAIDDNDMTFVNGILVGQTNGYNVERVYEVPANVLRKESNELLIRVVDNGGGGGLRQTKLSTNIAGKEISDFDWQIRFSVLTINRLNNKIPNLIYNAMIHPIIDYPIKGAIWYQGESNTGTLQQAYDYRSLMRTLIMDWRNKWNQEELPFYYVQLANFRQPMEEPGNDGWAVIRESMTDVLKLPFTGQAVITDIGEANDIHPRNKKDVGYRLALPARNQVYGEDVVPGSPMYASHQKVGNHIVVDFQQIGDGLVVKDRYGYLKGFTIAGADGKFVWAQAKLENNRVTVWHEGIREPVAVRYAWETNPEDANLFSKDGLPVTPFRTDDFKIVE